MDTLNFTMVTYGLSFFFFFDNEVSFVSFYDFYIDLLFTI